MSRPPDQLAPSWLPRQQRRWVDAQLRKLVRPGVCSLCGSPFKHNSRTAGGLNVQGNVVLAGECCAGQVAAVFVRGLYSDRKYDFLSPSSTERSTNTKPTNEQIVNPITSYQEVIADADKVLDGIEQYGGISQLPGVNLLDSPWKDDDRDWFEQNQERSHRLRMPFPGELDGLAAKTPAGHALILLVRQVEPGRRIRAAVSLSANLLPLPDDEAIAHALFEVAIRRGAVPPDRQALIALIEKYKTEGQQQ
jgi:hypothetical protein